MMLRHKFYLCIVFIICLCLIGCSKKEQNKQSVTANLNMEITHNFTNGNDVKNIDLNLCINQPILVREIFMQIGAHKLDIEKPVYNDINLLYLNSDMLFETIHINITNKTISNLMEPNIDDFPDYYGTDWHAYEKAKDKYDRELTKYKDELMDSVFTSMKKGNPVTFELRGKIKNITVQIPQDNIEKLLSLWDVYKQM